MTSPFSFSSRPQGSFFIVGGPRTGTTMLQCRLRNYPRISLPTGESYFFIPPYRNQENYGDLSRLKNARRVLQAMHAQSRNFLETDLHSLKFNVDALGGKLHAEGQHTMPAIISGLCEKNAQGKTPLVLDPLKAGNAGKWRSKMTPAQIRAFESAAGRMLREFGYDLVTPGEPPALAVKAAYRLHNKLFTHFWKRARRTFA